MPVVPLPELLAAARQGGYAVGYFEAWDSYSLEAVVEAAEAERSPVVIGFGCAMVDGPWLDAGGIEMLAGMATHAAGKTTVPVSVLFNETHTLEQAQRGVEAGFSAAMVDTCNLTEDEARQVVAELARWAHERGAAVEGELGHLPNFTGTSVDASGSHLTEPGEAAEFVRATGVDCLAVSVGNVHLLENQEAPVQLDRIAAVGQAAGVPLVLHGGTGLPAGAIPAVIAGGVAKINVGTGLKRAFLEAMREALALDASPHDLLGSHKPVDAAVVGKAKMGDEVRRLMRLYGSAGRAGS
ncbi:MAG: class II fructose-bisphosphate aldolase [Acidimicrobiales bacterium]|jgi:ketose-bisphosphate aldolase